MDDHNCKERDTWNIAGNARYHLVSRMDYISQVVFVLRSVNAVEEDGNANADPSTSSECTFGMFILDCIRNPLPYRDIAHLDKSIHIGMLFNMIVFSLNNSWLEQCAIQDLMTWTEREKWRQMFQTSLGI